MMSAVKIQCPHAKALPFHGAIIVQTSAFLPGPSPWKKRWLLGKEPDLPTRQDIHVCLPTHSGDGNLGSCTHATPASCILSFVLFVLCPRLGVAQSTENALQLAKQLTKWLLSHFSTVHTGRGEKEQGCVSYSELYSNIPSCYGVPVALVHAVTPVYAATTRGAKPHMA